MDKIANAALGIVAVVLALIILIIYLSGVASRGCNSNKDCPTNAYCGSDYECHEFPAQILVQENKYIPAALIMGIALIIAAYLFRGGKIPFLKQE